MKWFRELNRGRKAGSPLILQWHITDRCNLRCHHCYQEGIAPDPEFEQLLLVLDQYLDLLAIRSRESGKRIPGQINITGGEPFLRDDFLHLLQIIREKKLPFAILTNGQLISRKIARYIKTLEPLYVQVSIEGTRRTHDDIRGRGTLEKTLEALREMKRAGLTTMVSFTAHRGNFREFPAVVELCRRVGVNRLWSDRLIPSGAGSQLTENLLSPFETREFFKLMTKEQGSLFRRQSPVIMHRALQFLVAGNKPYRCNAADRLIAIMPNGTVFPCRRLPISLGNCFTTPLTEIIRNSQLANTLRDRKTIPISCRDCEHGAGCGGGLRCLANAVHGDPFLADPGCWLAKVSR